MESRKRAHLVALTQERVAMRRFGPEIEGISRVANVRRFSLMMAVATLVVGPLAAAADAASPSELEACFLEAINDVRAANGAEPLTGSSSLAGYGRTHSAAMADAGELYHSAPGDLDPYLPAGWRSWGENVGYATGSEDCEWLFEGFWESPDHRNNMLEPSFDIVGIGVFIDASDTLWTTHVFVDSGDPPPAPTTTTTSTTTTTVAPSTTTTSTTSTTTSTTTMLPPTTTTTTPTRRRGAMRPSSPESPVPAEPATKRRCTRSTSRLWRWRVPRSPCGRRAADQSAARPATTRVLPVTGSRSSTMRSSMRSRSAGT